jgi:hypothetical protein
VLPVVIPEKKTVALSELNSYNYSIHGKINEMDPS